MQARPTVYKGIQMRSRLEAQAAQKLDALHWAWEYEPQCFANEGAQYLPDFSIDLLPHPRYVEVKPGPILTDPLALGKAIGRMQIIWDSEPDAELILMVGEGFPADFDVVLSALGHRDRRWRLRSRRFAIPLLLDDR